MTDEATTREVDFDHPPLNEVVFSVQFDKEVIDEIGVLSEFWPEIKNDYRKHEKQARLPPAAESFETAPKPPELPFQFLAGPPGARYWFLSADATLIVQVQSDRLLFNWRQVEGDEEYPHFDTLAPQFASLLDTFLACPSVAQADAKVAWCELQYVNPIEASGDDGTHGQLARILNFLKPDPDREVLPTVEDTQLQQRFRIAGDDGAPIGRLYLTAVPAYRNHDGAPMYVVTLLARGRPGPGDPPASVMAFINLAHRLIVKGFREVTTPEMHRIWGTK